MEEEDNLAEIYTWKKNQPIKIKLRNKSQRNTHGGRRKLGKTHVQMLIDKLKLY